MKHLKKIVSLLLVLCMVIALPVAVSADTSKVPTAPVNSANIKIDDEYLQFVDAIPENVSGRIMIPYRVIFEYLGATVDYDGETGIISGEKDGMRLEMKNGVKTIDYTAPDGTKSKIQMDVAPYIKNGRTFVPIRFISSTLGYSVGWDQDMRTVIVIDTEKLYKDLEKDFSLVISTGSLSPDANKTFEVNGDVSICMHIDDESGSQSADIVMKTAGLMKGFRSVLDLEMTVDADGMSVSTTGKMRSDLDKGIMEMQLAGITPEGQWEDVGASALGVDGMDSLMNMTVSGTADMSKILLDSIRIAEDDYTVDSYEQMVQTYALAKSVYGDEAFVKSGNTYTSVFDISDFVPADALASVSADMGFSGKMVIQKDSSGKVKNSSVEIKLYSDEPSFEMVLAQDTTSNSSDIAMSMTGPGLELRIDSSATTKLTNKTLVW